MVDDVPTVVESNVKFSLLSDGLELLRSYEKSIDLEYTPRAQDLRMAIYALESLLLRNSVPGETDFALRAVMDAIAALRLCADVFEKDPSQNLPLKIRLNYVGEKLQTYLERQQSIVENDVTHSASPGAQGWAEDPLRLPRFILNLLRRERGLTAA